MYTLRPPSAISSAMRERDLSTKRPTLLAALVITTSSSRLYVEPSAWSVNSQSSMSQSPSPLKLSVSVSALAMTMPSGISAARVLTMSCALPSTAANTATVGFTSPSSIVSTFTLAVESANTMPLLSPPASAMTRIIGRPYPAERVAAVSLATVLSIMSRVNTIEVLSLLP